VHFSLSPLLLDAADAPSELKGRNIFESILTHFSQSRNNHNHNKWNVFEFFGAMYITMANVLLKNKMRMENGAIDR
jgi:hypothetical protein